jgi:drug/metabolite transporter (DMT)-like permease
MNHAFQWLFVALIVAGTTIGDILQSVEMKKHGEIHDFHPSGIWAHLAAFARRPYLLWAVFCMAISFFAFMLLLSFADLSFAVPATAASYVVETVLARLILKEHIDFRRWAGALLVAGGVALLV